MKNRFTQEVANAYYARSADTLLQLCVRVETLFDAIAHGDTAHRQWLEKAIADHLAGRPVQHEQQLAKKE